MREVFSIDASSADLAYRERNEQLQFIIHSMKKDAATTRIVTLAGLFGLIEMMKM